jgi:hypothetical protein
MLFRGHITSSLSFADFSLHFAHLRRLLRQVVNQTPDFSGDSAGVMPLKLGLAGFRILVGRQIRKM